MKTTITKEQLDELWNAIEYTRATIGPGCTLESKQDPEWGILTHTARTYSSRNFLDQAIDLLEQLKKSRNFLDQAIDLVEQLKKELK